MSTVPAVERSARTERLGAHARARFRASCDAATEFFAGAQHDIAAACEEMARRFRAGGRLFVFGSADSASDARHVSVEFVHPVIVGKRALPAVALGGESGPADDDRFARELRTLAAPNDIAMALTTGSADGAVTRALDVARAAGLLTLAITGRQVAPLPAADLMFSVPWEDRLVAQEIHETLYHVLWELVHVFLDHGGNDV